MATVHYKLRGTDKVQSTTEEKWAEMNRKHPRSFVKVASPPIKVVKAAEPAKASKNTTKKG